MNILVAPNSMKGSLNAFDFADIVEKAFMQSSSKFVIRKVPVADGGDFTGAVLKHNLKAREKSLNVKDPLGRLVDSKYAIVGNKAIIEMADASGMKLVESGQLNPLKASSYGTGQLIMDAINEGCSEVLLAIGGSATVDGGMGMMNALGIQAFDKNGQKISGNGQNLKKVQKIETGSISNHIDFKIICDVDNPLLGENGAAQVFGPQKGATPEMVVDLEKGLKNWVGLLEKMSDKKIQDIEGAGAAGGIAAPLIALYNAQMVPGADFVLDQLNFDEHVKWADIVITGEGKIDSQTLNNKAPFAVAKRAIKFKKPVFAIGGKVEKEAFPAFDGVFSLTNGPLSLEYAMNNVRELLYNFSWQLAKTIAVISK